ncbi:hypothetical protein Pla175_14080 [Pirellulimonas nuda]|uniref:3-keto-alpha-glucoside-1,2-lyase/3-keto-2-hydroxy-glucal hydratase domain-containing protein n=1 Tax=Pirellulimonas nuda TaxID=2528009 RepID=A0A518D982_9BACT|nr:DUF1080 domain-containing protein [Pirellulimonas nuda]QDU88038.1 hypothetical protein Pla175_14080 [Pirellulimonas nuda]
MRIFPLRSIVAFALVWALIGARPVLAEQDEAGFRPLFDGKTLEGWDGDPALWQASDGVIRSVTTDDAPLEYNQFLIWDGEVGDFVLRLEFRVADRGVGNSGVQYRSKRMPDAGNWVVGGYQADIERTNKHMGILYEERGRGILANRGEKVELTAGPKGVKKQVVGKVGDPAEIVDGVRAGEWQTLEVSAVGNELVHKLNGRTTVRVVDNDAAHAAQRGIVALQVHKGPAMQIEFRNIRLKDIARNDGAVSNE